MRRRRHPLLGAISGLLFGLFLGLTLLLYGVLPLDSVLLVYLPLGLLVLGLILGALGPIRLRAKTGRVPPPPPPSPQPSETEAPPPAP